MSSDWYLIVMLLSDAALIGIVFLFCRFIQKRKLRTLGFVKKDIVKEYALGMLTGFFISHAENLKFSLSRELPVGGGYHD